MGVALLGDSALAEKTGEASDVVFTGHVLEPRKLPLTDLSALKLPDGFKVTIFAKDLVNPRMMAVSDDGTVYVTRRSVGDVVMLKDGDHDGIADVQKVVANRPQMHGVAIKGDTMYLATIKDVYRATIESDGTLGQLERIIDDLPDSGQHPSRTLGIGPDGMLYISVGSTCNACTESSPESATILRATPDGKKRTIFASGLRNTIGFGWHPASGVMVGADHNIDWHGDDQPAEEINVLSEGKFYGWPYVLSTDFLNPQDDPPGDITLEQLAMRTEKPALSHTAHAAPMQLAFYSGTMLPADYRGDAFIAMRGSWNRKPPSGYEVMRVRFKDGKPSTIEPFLTGFLQKDGDRYIQHGRLAGVAIAKDGALLVSDDENGVIYRIAYDGPATGARPALPELASPVSTSRSSELAARAIGSNSAQRLDVSSTAFDPQSAIPLLYSSYGENISPPLSWTAGPSDTKSYVIIVDDPDAKPNLVNHWMIFNIPADVTSLPEGVPVVPSLALPKNARQGSTIRGVGYFGPRPPPEDKPHRYHFQVFALDRMLDLKPEPDRFELIDAMREHVVAHGTLIGTFDRSPETQEAADSAKGIQR